MDPDAASAADRVVQRRSHDGVRELEAVDVDLLEQARRDAFLERAEQIGTGRIGHVLDEPDIEPLTDDRRQHQRAPGRLGEPAQTIGDGLAHAVRNADRFEWHDQPPSPVHLDERSGLDEMEGELAAEERIAPGLLMDETGQQTAPSRPSS